MKVEDCFKKGLLKKDAKDMENAMRSLDLARMNIEDASKNLEIERYRVVVILSYTAMFHAARAILFKDGIKERSHECIPLYLKANYPELESLANTLDQYRLFRHSAIYGLDFNDDPDEGKEALESANELLEKIEDVIKKGENSESKC